MSLHRGLTWLADGFESFNNGFVTPRKNASCQMFDTTGVYGGQRSTVSTRLNFQDGQSTLYTKRVQSARNTAAAPALDDVGYHRGSHRNTRAYASTMLGVTDERKMASRSVGTSRQRPDIPEHPDLRYFDRHSRCFKARSLTSNRRPSTVSVVRGKSAMVRCQGCGEVTSQLRYQYGPTGSAMTSMQLNNKTFLYPDRIFNSSTESSERRRPKSAPVTGRLSSRELLKHNYVIRGTMPHFCNFVKPCSVYDKMTGRKIVDGEYAHYAQWLHSLYNDQMEENLFNKRKPMQSPTFTTQTPNNHNFYEKYNATDHSKTHQIYESSGDQIMAPTRKQLAMRNDVIKDTGRPTSWDEDSSRISDFVALQQEIQRCIKRFKNKVTLRDTTTEQSRNQLNNLLPIDDHLQPFNDIQSPRIASNQDEFDVNVNLRSQSWRTVNQVEIDGKNETNESTVDCLHDDNKASKGQRRGQSASTAATTDTRISTAATTDTRISGAATTDTRISGAATTDTRISTAATTDTRISTAATTDTRISTAATTDTRISTAATTDTRISGHLLKQSGDVRYDNTEQDVTSRRVTTEEPWRHSNSRHGRANEMRNLKSLTPLSEVVSPRNLFQDIETKNQTGDFDVLSRPPLPPIDSNTNKYQCTKFDCNSRVFQSLAGDHIEMERSTVPDLYDDNASHLESTRMSQAAYSGSITVDGSRRSSREYSVGDLMYTYVSAFKSVTKRWRNRYADNYDTSIVSRDCSRGGSIVSDVVSRSITDFNDQPKIAAKRVPSSRMFRRVSSVVSFQQPVVEQSCLPNFSAADRVESEYAEDVEANLVSINTTGCHRRRHAIVTDQLHSDKRCSRVSRRSVTFEKLEPQATVGIESCTRNITAADNQREELRAVETQTTSVPWCYASPCQTVYIAYATVDIQETVYDTLTESCHQNIQFNSITELQPSFLSIVQKAEFIKLKSEDNSKNWVSISDEDDIRFVVDVNTPGDLGIQYDDDQSKLTPTDKEETVKAESADEPSNRPSANGLQPSLVQASSSGQISTVTFGDSKPAKIMSTSKKRPKSRNEDPSSTAKIQTNNQSTKESRASQEILTDVQPAINPNPKHEEPEKPIDAEPVSSEDPPTQLEATSPSPEPIIPQLDSEDTNNTIDEVIGQSKYTRKVVQGGGVKNDDWMQLDMQERLNIKMWLRRLNTGLITNTGKGDLLIIKKPPLKMQAWMNGRLALSRQSSRFELPIDMRTLERMTPIEYLSKYCVITSRRQMLYDKIYNKNKDGRTGKLGFADLQKALTDVLIHSIDNKSMKLVIDTLQIAEDTVIEKKLFYGIAAYSERLLYPIFARGEQTTTSAQKETIESADFCALEWKFHGINVNSNMRTIFETI